MRASHVFSLASVVCFLAILLNCSDQQNDQFPTIPGNVDGGGDAAPANAKPAQPHANLNAQPKVTECGKALGGAGVCTVTSTSTTSKARVIRGTILTPEETLHGGEVLIDSTGLITCAACDCSGSAAYGTASVITCPNGVVSAGLINPHEHLTYQNNAPIGHGEERYENRSDWQGQRGHTRLNYKSGANNTVQAYGELRFVLGGATSIAGGGGVPGLLRNLDTQADELEGAPVGIVDSDVFPLGSPSKNIASGCAYSGRTAKGSVSQLEGYLPHISEGIDQEAHNELTCLSGNDNFNVVQPQTGIIHGVALTAADAALIQQDRAKIVWSPRSNVDLYGNTAPAVMLDLAGVAIALGTDWVPSGSMNVLRELKCADEWNQTRFDKHFTDADLWRMATIHSALATGTAGAIGMIKAGYLGDVAVFDGTKSKDHRAVIDAGVEDVQLVLRGGKVLYGNTDLVTSGVFADATGCEAYPGGICGQDKMVCLDLRFTKTGGTAPPLLADVLAAGATYYPAFFCKDKTPTNEPSCFPFRAASVKSSSLYTGTITDDDKDGDGIVDVQDNCPLVFNPIRPMDSGRQADADNDGIGDACDECPTSDKQDCGHSIAGDIDSDGVPNGTDNCPDQANPDQADSDNDGRGDVCDACSGSNPGATPCLTSIHVLRNPDEQGHPSNASIVSVDGYVTAKKTNNFLYVQEGITGAPWAGIYVIAGTNAGSGTTGPKIGSKVTVTGLAQEVFGMNQITAASVTITDPTQQKLIPLPLETSAVNTDAGKAAEPYESLLVTVGGGTAGALTVTKDNPDTGPFFAFIVTGNLWLDDTIFSYHGTLSPDSTVCTADPAPADCAYPRPTLVSGTTFSRLTGIMGWSFSQRRLYPRGTTTAATGLCVTGTSCPDYVRP